MFVLQILVTENNAQSRLFLRKVIPIILIKIHERSAIQLSNTRSHDTLTLISREQYTTHTDYSLRPIYERSFNLKMRFMLLLIDLNDLSTHEVKLAVIQNYVHGFNPKYINQCMGPLISISSHCSGLRRTHALCVCVCECVCVLSLIHI